jgi:hypothetical protein
MSNFNADAFMNTEVEGSSETEYTPIPEAEYTAVIKEVKADVTAKGQPLLELIWIIDNEEVRQLLDNDEPTVRQTIWLDIDPTTGSLQFGKNKNVQLGKLREALGQNDGSAWGPGKLAGNVATINLKHDLGDEGQIYARVKGVRA